MNVSSGKSYYTNQSSASDYYRFLEALWKSQLPNSKEIIRLMALPKGDRIYRGTKLPKGTLVIDKTGSTAMLCGDMGILVVKDKDKIEYPYIAIVIIQKDVQALQYWPWIMSRSNVIRGFSNIAYAHMRATHRF